MKSRKQSFNAEKIAVSIEAARNVVASVKEARLREIAFECVLNHFLNQPFALLKSGDENRLDKFIEVDVARTKTKHEGKTIKSSGPKAWLVELIGEGFFKDPRTVKQMIEELKTRSHHLKATDLTAPLQDFCHDKKLRRKPKVKGKRLEWVNW